MTWLWRVHSWRSVRVLDCHMPEPVQTCVLYYTSALTHLAHTGTALQGCPATRMGGQSGHLCVYCKLEEVPPGGRWWSEAWIQNVSLLGVVGGLHLFQCHSL